jgi:CO/xanthine dehydrogenase Mo-binding subunit
MSAFANTPTQVEDRLRKAGAKIERRDFLKGAGMFIVGLGVAGGHPFVRAAMGQAGAVANAAGPYSDPDFHQLDSWIVIHEDNTATCYVGKTDCGQGTGTSYRQFLSDELDIAYDKTTCIMGRSDITVNQGGSGGSTAMERDAWPLRRAAAEARRVLLEMGSKHLDCPVERLVVSDGVISIKDNPTKKVTYGELIGGNQFHATLTGQDVSSVKGAAKTKTLQEFKMVGKSPNRYDIPGKVDATQKWAVDVKLPGMVHARNVRPPLVGAKVLSIAESSVRNLPGFIAVVRKGNYIAVVCEREEQAINASRTLKVDWRKPAVAPFPASDELFDYMRSAKVMSADNPVLVGDPDAAFKSAAKVIEAEYAIPFQGHTAIGPAHAMADPSNGQMTIYTNDMKAYGMRDGVARFLDMPRDRVRVVWTEGPQAFGRTAADDAGAEAAYLAKELKRPVRMQWMRDEETAWDTKGPAFLVKLRGGLDAQGNLVAYDYQARAADYNHLGYNEPDTVLIAQLMGSRRANPTKGNADMPSDLYAIPNRRMTAEVVSLPVVWETPVRTGNLRDPNGPQATFPSESFIDELAAAANADPYEFRLKMLMASTKDDDAFRRARSIAVLKAAAETYGWDRRSSPKKIDSGKILTGRGIAYTFRGATMAAEIAEVEVNRETGHVWAKRLVCAYDCGLVVNPQSLRHSVECGLLHGLSRALHEEVQFNTEKVTSVDWITHPTLRHADTPAQIDVVMVNGDPKPDRPDLRPRGGGEASLKPTIAAVANAIYDATGVRLRRAPFRDARVLAALKAAAV